MAEVTKQEAVNKVETTKARRVYTPAVDIVDKKDHILLIADMPGVDEKHVDITLEKDELTIYGTVEAQLPQNHRLAVAEYGIGDYRRVFIVPNDIDREKIQASMKNGVLRVILPKLDTAKTRKIAVTA